MKEQVYIKSFPNGLSIHIDDSLSFDEIISKVAEKFSASRNFFGKVVMALSIVGVSLTDEQELALIQTISEHSDVKIRCIVDKDPDHNKVFAKTIEKLERNISGDFFGEFMRGSLVDQDVLETENSIVILGDVEKGSTVYSEGSIIVLGSLSGKAYAGIHGDNHAFVAALEMAPEKIKIGDFKYLGEGKAPKRKMFSSKKAGLVARVENERIVFEQLTKDLLKGF